MGSDWSVSTPNPLLEMEIAVDRVGRREPRRGEVFLPDERLELIDALAAFTAGSAYVNHLDARPARSRSASWPTWRSSTATCSTGAPAPIGEARVLGTFVDGVPVYEDPALDG